MDILGILLFTYLHFDLPLDLQVWWNGRHTPEAPDVVSLSLPRPCVPCIVLVFPLSNPSLPMHFDTLSY